MINTTPTPNYLFDKFLPDLKPAELKVLLVVIRQTLGWSDRRTGKRKQWDWIANKQFRDKTGLSNKSVSVAIESLLNQNLIAVCNAQGIPLTSTKQRQYSQAVYFGVGRYLMEGVKTIK